ncbi:esterase [Spirochaetia bacterium]|nr:esterase [Spirochaetia bacterium]
MTGVNMANYFSGPMNLYTAGVFDGIVHFKEGELLFSLMDQKSRFLGTPQPLSPGQINGGDFMALPFEAIHGKWPEYKAAPWEGDTVTLPCGDTYSRHITINNAQVWAQRNADPAVDIVTVDGSLIAFMQAHRYGLEAAVLAGYEDLTPLRQYTDPAAKLSQADYGIDCLGISTSVMRDGVKLAQRVYLPCETAGGGTGKHDANRGSVNPRWPTILVRSCYTKERMAYKLSKYVNKGYALVMQDVRGRGDSEGDLEPFAYERDDTSDTIDWIISRDWSDGNVGTWGASYLGHVVVQGATSGHSALKCVIDEVNVGSPFVDTVRRGGALCSEPLLCWTLAQSSGQRPNMFYMSDEVKWEPIVTARPIKDIVKNVLKEPANDLWEKWTTHDEENEWWQRCNFSRHFDKVKAPMLVISGWYDGDGLGISETWRALTKYDVPGRRIILGPWAHSPNTTRDVEGVDLGNDAIIYHFDITNLRWYDHYLKGIDNGVDRESRAAYYVVGENKWHTSADWSPAESSVQNWYFGGEQANSVNGRGTLSVKAPENAGSDTFRYNPEFPAADLVSKQVGNRAPVNYRGHELRSDMLVYTSEALESDLVIAGEISAEFYASSSAKDTDWVLRLLDVDSAGNARQLSQNLIRAKFRNGFDHIELLEPGKVEKYTLLMESNGWRVGAGHRLRLHVMSSALNTVFPNTNTGEAPFTDTTTVCADNSIWHGGKYPSCIKLPVLGQ